MKEYYEVIFKRRSTRKFGPLLKITPDELNEVKKKTDELFSLNDALKGNCVIVPRTETTAKWGEYCLLYYGTKDVLGLLNAGYILEQADLYLQSRDIGVCWYGLASPKDAQANGMDYIIMLSFGKCTPENFRKSVSEFDRLNAEVIWEGEFCKEVKDAVRLCPSACNSQPWRLTSTNNEIKLYRDLSPNEHLTKDKMDYFNSIDMGIFMTILETALEFHGFGFNRKLNISTINEKRILIAEYTII